MVSAHDGLHTLLSTDTVGEVCPTDTSGRVRIVENFISFAEINPDESGCQYAAQCSSQWPGATCNSAGICRCPFSRPPQQTRDGPVCFVPGDWDDGAFSIFVMNFSFFQVNVPPTLSIQNSGTPGLKPYPLVRRRPWPPIFSSAAASGSTSTIAIRTHTAAPSEVSIFF